MKPWLLLSNIPLSPEAQAHLRYAAGQRCESYQQVHLWIPQRNKNKIDVFQWPNINRLKGYEGHSETSHSMNRPLGGGSGTMARHRPTNPQMIFKWGKRFLCHASETSALHFSHKMPYKNENRMWYWCALKTVSIQTSCSSHVWILVCVVFKPRSGAWEIKQGVNRRTWCKWLHVKNVYICRQA